VKDHKRRQAKYHTISKMITILQLQAGALFYNTVPAEPVFQLNQKSCLRSSLLQKASETLAGEEITVNCANFYQRSETKVSLAKEKKLRTQWESVKAAISEILDASDHDFIELFIAFLDKTGQNSLF
jgi:hypothetical protein